jgi:hypothetical protein
MAQSFMLRISLPFAYFEAAKVRERKKKVALLRNQWHINRSRNRLVPDAAVIFENEE